MASRIHFSEDDEICDGNNRLNGPRLGQQPAAGSRLRGRLQSCRSCLRPTIRTQSRFDVLRTSAHWNPVVAWDAPFLSVPNTWRKSENMHMRSSTGSTRCFFNVNSPNWTLISVSTPKLVVCRNSFWNIITWQGKHHFVNHMNNTICSILVYFYNLVSIYCHNLKKKVR